MPPGRRNAAALQPLNSQPNAARRGMRIRVTAERKGQRMQRNVEKKLLAELLLINLQHPHKSFRSCAVTQCLFLCSTQGRQKYYCAHLDTAGILIAQAVISQLYLPCSLCGRCLQGRWGRRWRGWCRGAGGWWSSGFEWSGSMRTSGCRWTGKLMRRTDQSRWSAATQTCSVGRERERGGWHCRKQKQTEVFRLLGLNYMYHHAVLTSIS